MRLVVIEKNKRRLNRFFEWFIYTLGYALVLITISVLFKSLDIDNSSFGVWAFLAAAIMSFLNRTIKPVLVWLTLPLTALTLGLFYPFINVLIMYLCGFILGSHFVIKGLFIPFFIAILISIMNVIMENLVVEPIIRRVK